MGLGSMHKSTTLLDSLGSSKINNAQARMRAFLENEQGHRACKYTIPTLHSILQSIAINSKQQLKSSQKEVNECINQQE
eukprot:4759234-Amphidinium_carterae.1